MKGCIINNKRITIKKIFEDIEDVDKYNWLITNIECYPNDEHVVKKLMNEYCWIRGDELIQLLSREEFQWIWGVFSAFPKELKLSEVLAYKLPYADGYIGFWKNPISIQHPLAKKEIVAWDGSIILVISDEDKTVDIIMEKKIDAEDLELYNIK